MSKKNWKSRETTILCGKYHLRALVFHSHERYATSSFITQFIFQDVSINLEIWYLPGCRTACTVKTQAKSRFPDVYTFYLPLNALSFSVSASRGNSQLARDTRRMSTKAEMINTASEYKDSRANILKIIRIDCVVGHFRNNYSYNYNTFIKYFAFIKYFMN